MKVSFSSLFLVVLTIILIFYLMVFFCRYMADQVPLAPIDIEAGVKAKFGDLAVDAGSAALRILLLGHAMELKHGIVEKQYKEVVEDVEKWKHKATDLEGRLKEALKEKKTAEKELDDMKEVKKIVEIERDAHKDEVEKL